MAKHPRTWLVRAGKNATFIDDFRANSLVAIGWRETGPIPPTADDDFLTELFDRTFATAKPGSRRGADARVLQESLRVSLASSPSRHGRGRTQAHAYHS